MSPAWRSTFEIEKYYDRTHYMQHAQHQNFFYVRCPCISLRRQASLRERLLYTEQSSYLSASKRASSRFKVDLRDREIFISPHVLNQIHHPLTAVVHAHSGYPIHFFGAKAHAHSGNPIHFFGTTPTNGCCTRSNRATIRPRSEPTLASRSGFDIEIFISRPCVTRGHHPLTADIEKNCTSLHHG